MGKKARSDRGKEKAQGRKFNKSLMPPPPASLDAELGSAKLLENPKVPGSVFKALDRDGYDDGGVADLTLVIDLDDSVLRRKRGDNNYFTSLKADLLPRVTAGQYAALTRRDQKIRLAKLLFSEDDEEGDESSPSEVYIDSVDGKEDEFTKKCRLERLNSAKFALRLSSVLREPACASLSLSEISKRYLSCHGKEGGEAALRCVDKAIEIAADGFWDSEEIALEANEDPKLDPKYEKNATFPGLGHANSLKLQPIRVSHLCLRSAYLHRGNALAALGRDDEARESYKMVLPMIVDEPRSCRLDWERSSIYVNIGNSFTRQGNFEKAFEEYATAEKLGKEHVEVEIGNKVEGMGIMIVAMRARSFALKKASKDDEAKKQMREVLDMKSKLTAEQEKQKAEHQAIAEKEQAAAKAAADAASTKPQE